MPQIRTGEFRSELLQRDVNNQINDARVAGVFGRSMDLALVDANVDRDWARAAKAGASTRANSYFDYYFSGQDIQVQMMGVDQTLPIIEFAFQIEQQKRPVYGFWSYCVDNETQAFTKRGWVDGKDLKMSDIILSMDEEGQLQWSAIKSIFRNPNYTGKLHHLTAKNMDALVTPGHKFRLVNGELIPVEQLFKNDAIRTMGEALQEIAETYEDAFVELVGWYVTEGHDRGDVNSIELAQSQKVNPLFVGRIKACLNQLDVQYSTSVKKDSQVVKFYIGTKNPIVNRMKEVAPKKILSIEFLTKLSTRQRIILLNTMLDGDGGGAGKLSKGGSGKSGARTYGQKLQEAAEAIVPLCTMLGIPTTVTPLSSGHGWTTTLKWRKITWGHNIDFHGGFVRKKRDFKPATDRPSRAKIGNVPTVDYEGLVWCPETEYGTFVCRRGGRVYVTGNTYDAMLRGSRVVTGAFAMATKYPGYMTDLVAMAAGAREESGNNQYPYFRGLTEDDANIQKYWGKNDDPAYNVSGRNLFSIHPPFSFGITYGVQDVSYANTGSDFFQNYYAADNNILLSDENQRLIDTEQPQNKLYIDAVELTSCQRSYTSDGAVCVETYQFIARDIVDPYSVKPDSKENIVEVDSAKPYIPKAPGLF